MKYNKQQYDKVVQHLPAIIKALGLEGLKSDDYTIGILHDIHYRLYVQLTYPVNNPNVWNTQGKPLAVNGGHRLLAHDESFELYPDGCVDDNITTAMRKAVKDVLAKGNSTERAPLCRCNHCNGIFIDKNPQTGAKQHDLSAYPGIQELQLFFVELNGPHPDYWGCPVCCTDGFLVDL